MRHGRRGKGDGHRALRLHPFGRGPGASFPARLGARARSSSTAAAEAATQVESLSRDLLRPACPTRAKRPRVGSPAAAVCLQVGRSGTPGLVRWQSGFRDTRRCDIPGRVQHDPWWRTRSCRRSGGRGSPPPARTPGTVRGSAGFRQRERWQGLEPCSPLSPRCPPASSDCCGAPVRW